MKRVRGELVKYSIILILLLTGCSIFEPVPESYKNRLALTGSASVTYDDQGNDASVALAEPVGPVTEIVTTDMVEYVNIVTGETATGPSHGGYLDNHPDWEQVPLDGVL